MASTGALYDRLPPVLRTAAVSAYGAWLLAWRVGPGYEACRRQALERDGWSAEQLAHWQRGRLAEVLERAATRVPYYRRHWEGSVGSPWTRLDEWPVLSKTSVRAEARQFIAEGRRAPMRTLRTSGSTGTPLAVRQRRRTEQQWFALFEARVLNWNGLSRTDRWASFGGRLVVPVSRKDPPFWAWCAPLNQLYMSAYHLSQRAAPAYLEAIAEHGAAYLLGYSSSVHSLAKFVLSDRLPAPQLRAVVTVAEPLSSHQRAAIARAFGCPVVATYGMVELVAAASDCRQGRLHLWPEVGFVEVLKDDADEPAAPGETGRLICTSLLNEDMPLVRYEVGDRGALASEDGPCACGRALPVVATVEGRIDDVVVLRDGRRIGRLGPALHGNLPVRESQVVQEAFDLIRVVVVPDDGYSSETTEAIKKRLQDRVGGDVAVRVEIVSSIPRGPSGKFKAVVNRLPDRGTRRG